MAISEMDFLKDKYPLGPEQLRIILESIPANVFFKDPQGRYRLASHICSMLNGGEDRSIIGKTDLEVQPDPDLGKKFYEEDLRIAKTGESLDYEQEMVFGGISYHYHIIKKPVYDGDGNLMGLIGLVMDITEFVEMQNKIKQFSEIDSLTGCRNRNYLTRMLSENRKFDYPLAVIVADCNGLKKINDTMGHRAGDFYLCATVNHMLCFLEEEDKLIRTGGDEFLIIMENCDEKRCIETIQNIQKSEKLSVNDKLPLSTSFGYKIINDASEDFNSAVSAADRMMYENKQEYYKKGNT